MSVLATCAAVGVSLGALGYLAATDPKRRRAFRLPPPGPRRAGLAWTVALLPGLVVPVWSGGAGFVAWLGAVTVAGWALAATAPGRGAEAWREAERHLAGLRDRAAGVLDATLGAVSRARPRRRVVVEMELRIAQLEAEVADLRRRLPTAEAARVIELARPAPQPIRSEA